MRARNNGRGLLITSDYKSWKMRLASYLDSQQSRKTAAVIVKRGRPLGALLFVVGLVFLCMLPKDEFNRKSFFDENALMVGLARREFRNQNSIGAFAKELQNIGRNEGEAMNWLESQFARLGMEVYSQNFTATRPVSFRTESPQVSGTNVYGILRAGRARSTEAIVLSAPYPSRSGHDSNDYGIALVLALADYSRTKTFWAKDIVFLVTTHDELGMQAWINAYMGLQTANIAAAPLAGRSGSIQAVINLELPTATVQYADIVIEGVNGILPNLDLVNVIVHLCESEGIPTAFHTHSEVLSHQVRLPQPNQHHHALLTVLAIATHQAPGLPLANHGLFLRHRIDSLTVRGVGAMATDQQSRSLVNLARALEGSLRSINNLLETLHHSEFFYYTSSRRRFISIGLYMPPLGLLLAPLALEMLSQWLLSRIPGLLEGSPAKDATGLPVRVPFPFQAVVKLLLLSFSSGLVLYAVPNLASLLQYPLKAEGMVASLLGVCGVSIVTPLFFRSLVDSSSWRMAKSFGLLVLLLLLTAVAMMNYSLAFFLVLALLPPAVLAQPWGASGKLPQVLRMAAVLLSSPPLFLLYCCTAYVYLFSSAPTDTPFDTTAAAANMAFTGVVFAYNSWHFVGSWINAAVCLLVWPIWLTSWSLCCQNIHESTSGTGTTSSSHLHSD